MTPCRAADPVVSMVSPVRRRCDLTAPATAGYVPSDGFVRPEIGGPSPGPNRSRSFAARRRRGSQSLAPVGRNRSQKGLDRGPGRA